MTNSTPVVCILVMCPLNWSYIFHQPKITLLQQNIYPNQMEKIHNFMTQKRALDFDSTLMPPSTLKNSYWLRPKCWIGNRQPKELFRERHCFEARMYDDFDHNRIALFDTAPFKKMNILFEWIFWILKKWIFCLNEYSGF